MKYKVKMQKLKVKINFGFTLIELLVAMAILGILASLAIGAFRTSQQRGRDAQRKSDLKQVANALELYYSDYNVYPDSTDGKIMNLDWGSDEFTDGKTTYFKELPVDPSGYSYHYSIDLGTSPQKYALFAYLENPKDPDIRETEADCGGTTACNFVILSANAELSDF